MYWRVWKCGFEGRRIVFADVRRFFAVMKLMQGFIGKLSCRDGLLDRVVIIKEIVASFTNVIIIASTPRSLLSLIIKRLCGYSFWLMPLALNRNYKTLSCLNVFSRISY